MFRCIREWISFIGEVLFGKMVFPEEPMTAEVGATVRILSAYPPDPWYTRDQIDDRFTYVAHLLEGHDLRLAALEASLEDLQNQPSNREALANSHHAITVASEVREEVRRLNNHMGGVLVHATQQSWKELATRAAIDAAKLEEANKELKVKLAIYEDAQGGITDEAEADWQRRRDEDEEDLP